MNVIIILLTVYSELGELKLDSTVLLERSAEYTEQITKEYIIEKVQAVDKPFYLATKRSFDVVVSLIAGIILLIPMLLIGLLVRIDSRGPALFKQERLGKNAKPFMLIKFRSMYINAEDSGPKWAERFDNRCTRVGKFLRKTRLDELPQLWNIFKGDMSFVGPRPERKFFYEQFETYIHGFSNRLVVRPGLTGLAQVNGGYDLEPEEKILYDIEYIKNQSFVLDLKCIIKTVKLIFTHEGAR